MDGLVSHRLLIVAVLALTFAAQGAGASGLTATPNPFSVSNAIIDVGQISVFNTVISGGSGTYVGNWIFTSPNVPSAEIPNAIPFGPGDNLNLVANAVSSNTLTLTFNGVTNTVVSSGSTTILGVWTFNGFAADNSNANTITTIGNTLTINPQLTGTPNALLQATAYDEGQIFQLTCASNTVTGGTPYGGTYFFQSLIYNAISNTLVHGNLNSRSGSSQGYCGAISPPLSGAGINPGTYYAIDQLADDATTPEIADSPPTGNFVVYANPSVTQFSLTTSTTYDVGQTVTYNVIVSNGVGPFTINLMTNGAVANSISGISAGTPTLISNALASTSDTSFNVVVTDTGSANAIAYYTFNSITNTINVNAAPTLTSFLPSNAVLDQGQALTFNVISNGGTGPFTYNLFYYNPGPLLANTITQSAGFNGLVTFTALHPGGPASYTYNVVATDTGTSTAFVFRSASNTVTIGAAPTLTLLTPSATSINHGQSVTYNVLLDGGVGPYTVNLINVNTNTVVNTIIAPVGYGGGSGNVVVFGAIVPALGTDTYNVVATDTGTTTPFVFNSIANTINVNAAPTLTSLTPSATSINQGQSVTYNVLLDGGVGPYTVNLINVNTNTVVNTIIAPVGYGGGSGNVVVFGAIVPALGTDTYNVVTTDTGATPAFVFNSITNTINVNAAPTTTIYYTTGGGAGGGYGGGGGGVSKPVVSNTPNGYNVSNVAQLNTFNVTVCGVKVTVTDNFITPNSTGVTINGASYTLSANRTAQVPGTSCVVDLKKISYLPIQQTVVISIYNNTAKVQIYVNINNVKTLVNASTNATVNVNTTGPRAVLSFIPIGPANVMLRNVTINIPQLPSNYTGLSVYNLTVSANAVKNSTISVTLFFNCSLPASRVSILYYSNGAWVPSKSVVNSASCSATAQIPADPLVVLALAPVPATTTVQTTTTAATTIAATTVPQQAAPSSAGAVIAAVVIIVIILLALWYYFVRSGRSRMR